jgi:uncharacterized membrane protein
LSAVLVAVGLFLAMLASEPGGRFLYGLAVGFAFALIYRLYFHLGALQQRLRELEQRVAAQDLATGARATTAPPAALRPAATAAAPAAASAPATAASRPLPPGPPPLTPAAPARPSPAYQPPPPPQPSAFDRAMDEFMAWLRRGNPVARAGIVVLFFGGSFLAKYAAEHSMFPLELRLALLGIGALALLGLGWRLRGERPVYAQTLQGGGIAGFYLTVFASTRLYHLLPLPLALGLMVTVALAAAVLAVAQNALALAVIGTSGGFLAPILLSTGGGSLAALFTYYTVLNLGVFAVAWFRAWRVLNLLGFVFTFGIAGLFRATAYGAAEQATMDGFLWLFFLLYVGVSILFSLRQKPDLRGYVSASLVFGLPLAVFSLHASITDRHGLALAWSALGMAVFYLALATALYRSGRDTLRLLAEAFAALGAIFATLTVPLAFDPHATASAWAIEGAGMIWLGVRQGRRLPRAFGILLQAAAGIAFLRQPESAAPLHPVLNGLYFSTVALALAGLGSGRWLHDNRGQRAGYETGLDLAGLLWGAAWWLGGGLHEIARYAPDYALGGCTAFAAASAAAFCWCGGRLRWPALLYAGVLLLPLTALFATLHALTLLHPLAQAGWLGWAALFPLAWWTMRQLEKIEAPAPPGLLPGLHAGGALLLVLLGAWESAWQVGRQTGGVWPILPWAAVPALALAFLGRRTLRPAWPLARHETAYRLYTGLPLSLFCSLWILLASVGSNGNPEALPYLPLLNPLDVTVLLLFAAQGLHWFSLPPAQRAALTPDDPVILPGGIAALAFLWLNSALIRALHYLAGTPLDAAGVMQSITVQASLSVFWGLAAFSAMTLSARRRQRAVWLAGAGLMTVLLAKLFLVDTAGRGTLARIVSFLIVGALLLITGYLSPLPPRRAEADKAPLP